MIGSDRHANGAAPGHGPAGPWADPRRWAALCFIGLAQVIVVIDVTVVNVALPSAQHELGVSNDSVRWVIATYTLAFGSLLPLGGRVADYAGHKRAFLIGLGGYAAASVFGGAAGSLEMLLTARVLQGAFCALLAPATLSLVAVLFTRSGERAKAFGILGAITAGGSVIGLMLGGLLTEHLGWRWCLYGNVSTALVAGIGGWLSLRDVRSAGWARFDGLGALLVTTGLFAILYACNAAETEGWSSPIVTRSLGSGFTLLGGFAVLQRRTAKPLLPPGIVRDRTRGSACLALGLSVVGMFTLFLVLNSYLQGVKHYSAVKAGVAFLPLGGCVLIGAAVLASRLLPRVPPRVLVVPGLLLMAGGTAWATLLKTGSPYASGVLPALVLTGLGSGLVMATCMNYAMYRVLPHDAGIAAACAGTAQQIGGLIGAVLLHTITVNVDEPFAVMTTASAWAAGILACAAVLVGVLMNTPSPGTRR